MKNYPQVSIGNPSSDDLLMCEDLEDIDLGASLTSAPLPLTHGKSY